MYGLQVYKLSQNQLIYKIFIHIHQQQQQQHMCVCVCVYAVQLFCVHSLHVFKSSSFTSYAAILIGPEHTFCTIWKWQLYVPNALHIINKTGIIHPKTFLFTHFDTIDSDRTAIDIYGYDPFYELNTYLYDV